MATTTTKTAAIRTVRTINLRSKLLAHHKSRRIKKAIMYLKEDIARHLKSDADSVKLSGDLNNYVLLRVARRMKSVKVTIEKIGYKINVDLAQELKRSNQGKAEPSKPEADKAGEETKKNANPNAKKPENATQPDEKSKAVPRSQPKAETKHGNSKPEAPKTG